MAAADEPLSVLFARRDRADRGSSSGLRSSLRAAIAWAVRGRCALRPASGRLRAPPPSAAPESAQERAFLRLPEASGRPCFFGAPSRGDRFTLAPERRLRTLVGGRVGGLESSLRLLAVGSEPINRGRPASIGDRSPNFCMPPKPLTISRRQTKRERGASSVATNCRGGVVARHRQSRARTTLGAGCSSREAHRRLGRAITQHPGPPNAAGPPHDDEPVFHAGQGPPRERLTRSGRAVGRGLTRRTDRCRGLSC